MLRSILRAMSVVILMAVLAGFMTVQFRVGWGVGCAYGERYNRVTQTVGFPAPAINMHSVYDRDEVDPYLRASTSVSVEPSGAALNLLTLAATLFLIGRGVEKLLSRFAPSSASIAVTGTVSSGVRNLRRLSFPRACP